MLLRGNVERQFKERPFNQIMAQAISSERFARNRTHCVPWTLRGSCVEAAEHERTAIKNVDPRTNRAGHARLNRISFRETKLGSRCSFPRIRENERVTTREKRDERVDEIEVSRIEDSRSIAVRLWLASRDRRRPSIIDSVFAGSPGFVSNPPLIYLPYVVAPWRIFFAPASASVHHGPCGCTRGARIDYRRTTADSTVNCPGRFFLLHGLVSFAPCFSPN